MNANIPGLPQEDYFAPYLSTPLIGEGNYYVTNYQVLGYPEMVPEGYVFYGWCDENDNNKLYFVGDKYAYSTTPATLTAIWATTDVIFSLGDLEPSYYFLGTDAHEITLDVQYDTTSSTNPCRLDEIVYCDGVVLNNSQYDYDEVNHRFVIPVANDPNGIHSYSVQLTTIQTVTLPSGDNVDITIGNYLFNTQVYTTTAVNISYEGTLITGDSTSILTYDVTGLNAVNSKATLDQYLSSIGHNRILDITDTIIPDCTYSVTSSDDSIIKITDFTEKQVMITLVGRGSATLTVTITCGEQSIERVVSVDAATNEKLLYLLNVNYSSTYNFLRKDAALASDPLPETLSLAMSDYTTAATYRLLDNHYVLIYAPNSDNNVDGKMVLSYNDNGVIITTTTNISELTSIESQAAFAWNDIDLNKKLVISLNRSNFANVNANINAIIFKKVIVTTGDEVVEEWQEFEICHITGLADKLIFSQFTELTNQELLAGDFNIVIEYLFPNGEFADGIQINELYQANSSSFKNNIELKADVANDEDNNFFVAQVINNTLSFVKGQQFYSTYSWLTYRIIYKTEGETDLKLWWADEEINATQTTYCPNGLEETWNCFDFTVSINYSLSPGYDYPFYLIEKNGNNETRIDLGFSIVNIRGITPPAQSENVEFIGNVDIGSTGDQGGKLLNDVSFSCDMPDYLPIRLEYNLSTPIHGTFAFIINPLKEDESRSMKELIEEAKNTLAGRGTGDFDLHISGYALGNLDYNPSARRWVMTYTGGGMTGQLSLSWGQTKNFIVFCIPVYLEIRVGFKATVDIMFSAPNNYHDLFMTEEAFDREFIYDFVSDIYLAAEGNITVGAGLGFDLGLFALKFGAEGWAGIGYAHRFVTFNLDGHTVQAFQGGEFTAELGIRVVFKMRILFWTKRYTIASASTSWSIPNGDWSKFPEGRPGNIADLASSMADNGFLMTCAVPFANDPNNPLWSELINPNGNLYAGSDGLSYAFLGYQDGDDFNDPSKYVVYITTPTASGWSEPLIFPLDTILDGDMAIGEYVYAANDTIQAIAFDATTYDSTLDYASLDIESAIAMANESAVYGAIKQAGVTNVVKLSLDGQMAKSPVIAVNGEKAVAMWLCSELSTTPTENGSELTYTNSSYWFSYYDGHAWSKASVFANDNDYNISSYQIAMSDDGFAIVAKYDQNNLGNSADYDIILFVYENNAFKTIAITQDSEADGYPAIQAIDDTFYLVTYVHYTADEAVLVGTGYRENGSLMSNYCFEQPITSANYQIVGNELANCALLNVVYENNQYGDIYAQLIHCIDGKLQLSQAYLVDEASDTLISITGGIRSDSDVTYIDVAYLTQQVDEEIEYTANLHTQTYAIDYAIANSDLSVNVYPNDHQSYSLRFVLKNEAPVDISSVKVVISGVETICYPSVTNNYFAFNLYLTSSLESIDIAMTVNYADGKTIAKTLENIQLVKANLQYDGGEISNTNGNNQEYTITIYNSGTPLPDSAIVQLYLTYAGEQITITHPTYRTVNNYLYLEGSTIIQQINSGEFSLAFDFVVDETNYSDAGIAGFVLNMKAVDGTSDIFESYYSDNEKSISVLRKSLQYDTKNYLSLTSEQLDGQTFYYSYQNKIEKDLYRLFTFELIDEDGGSLEKITKAVRISSYQSGELAIEFSQNGDHVNTSYVDLKAIPLTIENLTAAIVTFANSDIIYDTGMLYALNGTYQLSLTYNNLTITKDITVTDDTETISVRPIVVEAKWQEQIVLSIIIWSGESFTLTEPKAIGGYHFLNYTLDGEVITSINTTTNMMIDANYQADANPMKPLTIGLIIGGSFIFLAGACYVILGMLYKKGFLKHNFFKKIYPFIK